MVAHLTDRFFARHLAPDGRVVRHDQRGDTVSEGQAYALLLAVATADERRTELVWQWTRLHLQRTDALLSWHWAGAVTDAEPASDADLDAARALVLAGERFGRDDLCDDGLALAAAVLDGLTMPTDAGRVLLPGTWARRPRGPVPYNPSYASPAAYAVLGRASGDPRWAELAAGSAAVAERLLDSPLPPDWALVHPDGRAEPAAEPGPGIRYSYDAARLPIRHAESPAAADRARAASLLPALGSGSALPMVLALDGTPLSDEQHPLGYIARAAALGAAGREADAAADLRRALDLGVRYPGYYGDAWLALGAALLTTDTLGGHPVLDPSSLPG